MKITFITLFKDYFKIFEEHSIIKNAIKKDLLVIDYVNPRDFAEKDGRIDDTVFGGGRGMLMMIDPIVKAIESAKTKNSKVILLGAKGHLHKQKKARELVNEEHLIFVCGHYEGIDARVKHFIDFELSVGEFIITGGEMPAMLVADSIIRLIPGVIKEESHMNESFENNLLEEDHYTKPRDFRGYKVPENLLEGNRKKIDKLNHESKLSNTLKYILENKEENENGN